MKEYGIKLNGVELSNNLIIPGYSIVSIKYNWMFCNIYRNGSTSILRSLLNIHDKRDAYFTLQELGEDINFCAAEHISNDNKILFLNNNPYTFMYLRNPIERLVSCFVFKILDNPEKYTKNSPSYDFLNNYKLSKNNTKNFYTFLEYLMSKKEYSHEDHWKSQYSLSHYDKLKYKEVIDFKNFTSHWNKLSNVYENINKINSHDNKTNKDYLLNVIVKDKKIIKKIKDYYYKDYEIAKEWNIGWNNYYE